VSAIDAPPEEGVHEDVWSEQDTTPEAVDSALRRLLHERHLANGNLVPARVLNLVVVCDRDWKGEITSRLERVGRFHASRTVLCAVEERREQLDARALLSYVEPSPGGLGLIRERIELDIGPEHLPRLDSIVDPVLVGELPTLLWSPHGHPDAVAALRRILDVMLLDSDDDPEPDAALAFAQELLEDLYVVDLAWLRTTPWRERLAASFDAAPRRRVLRRVCELAVEHHDGSRASALLLAGWLASRLGWDARALSVQQGALRGTLTRPGGEVRVSLQARALDVPGLSSVRLASPELDVTLERGRGGLHARELGGSEQHDWQILGASRGEGGILGEGVRQALLRDVTYGPALASARGLSPA
jgi:glucose-6-phosphate dehydrogenase assembly protein OpcA